MRLVIDTHLHFYPFYDVGKALGALHSNLSGLYSDALIIGILTERSDCHFFQQLTENPGKFLSSKQEAVFRDGYIIIKGLEHPDIYLLPGRQIVTAENIEVLCLLVDCEIEDGLPVNKVIEQIHTNKGVPVIAWSPGKWLFKRRKIVKNLILTYKPGSLLFGDSVLRPIGWPKPPLMKLALSKGFAVICGSDPFPLPGEEQVMGKYGISIETDDNTTDLVEILRTNFLNSATNITCVGKRHTFLQVILKLFRHKFQKMKS